MDDATKKMMVTIVGPILRKGLITAGSALATHGIINSSQTETFVSVGMALVGLGWSFWNDYGRAIVLSQLEVLKAKSLAQAAKLQKHEIAPPDAQEVAAASAKSPDMATLSTEEVKKAAATLPAAVAGAATLVALIFAAQVIATPAFAQKRFVPTGNLPADIKNAVTPAPSATSDSSKSLRQKLLQDLAKPFLDLANFIGDDAENAIALSTSIPGIQDGHGQQCWIKARNFTAVIKAHPVPLTLGGMTDLEALRLLAISSKQLCEDTHCTQVFTDLKNAAITLAQTGFGAIGATAVRSAPSLQDVCTQIPNVPVADPLASVPAAPVIAPTGLGAAAPTPTTQETPK